MSATPSPLILDVRDLVVQYDLPGKSIKALRSVSLRVRRGEVLAVVGESGSGKSTLGLAILGLVKKPGTINGGSILYDNRLDLLKIEREKLREIRGRKISVIPQDPMTSLNPVKKVRDHFEELVKAHGSLIPLSSTVGRVDNNHKNQQLAEEERIKTVFEYVNLPPSALNAYPHELSGGMRQRIMIALALFFGPEVVLADEPTTSLDVVTEAQILDILKSLQRSERLTMIVFTHNFGVVSRLADRVAVMYAGNLVEIGELSELFRAPAHPYTQRLIASIPRLTSTKKELAFIPGFPADLSHLPSGCAFHPRCAYATQVCEEVVPELRTFQGASGQGNARNERLYACHHPLIGATEQGSSRVIGEAGENTEENKGVSPGF